MGQGISVLKMEVMFMEGKTQRRIKGFIDAVDRPPSSPDLNPIENVQKYLKDRLFRRKHRARNRADFIEALMEEWSRITGDFLLKLCDSMPGRYKACLKNKGGATKY